MLFHGLGSPATTGRWRYIMGVRARPGVLDPAGLGNLESREGG
jgi:hypothetical protein